MDFNGSARINLNLFGAGPFKIGNPSFIIILNPYGYGHIYFSLAPPLYLQNRYVTDTCL